MEYQELESLLTDLESERVERKASLSDKDKICQAICAFANDLPNNNQPGVVFIGANDDGSCANLKITDKLILDLADLRSNGNIHPFPVMSVQKQTVLGCELVVIIVEPSDSPPVRYKGRTWIRVGSRKAIATVEEERRLTEKRRSKLLPFDITPIPASRLNDLDLECFTRNYLPSALPPEIIEQNARSIEHQLAAMRFVTSETEVIPTVLGILTLGKEPRQFLPGAYIQFLRFAGTGLSDPIKDEKEIAGPIPELLNILDEIIKANLSIAVDIKSQPTEIRSPDYPIVSLQQITRNAVLHRNYEGTNAPVRINWFSDRVEINSPGGPFGQVSRENFGQPGITDYRNPNLAEVMKNLGYVQKFGIGLAIARAELEKNNNPALEFEIQDNFVLAVLRRRG